MRGADLVQESVPENVELKRRLLAEIEEHAPPDALIASSTSGLLPSVLQADMRRPERFLVAHPFNPVYLLPLVEIVGGERTSEESIARAIAFYESVGMRPLRVRSEIDGFVADRLLEALWREALWLVEDDVATVEEIDDAVRFGPGLRWAQMGTFLTYRIAGGEEGMHHFLEQFGPALQWPWTKLTDVPELDAELIDRIAHAVRRPGRRAVGARARAAPRRQPRGDPAGAARRAATGPARSCTSTRRACSRRSRRVSASRTRRRAAPPPRDDVSIPSWVDYNGHMTESRYGEVFGYATDAFLRHVGLDAAYLDGGHSAYTVEGHVRYLREAAASGAHRCRDAGSRGGREAAPSVPLHDGTAAAARLLATGEHMLLHVDTGAGRASPWQEPVASRVAAAAAAHAHAAGPRRRGSRGGDAALG